MISATNFMLEHPMKSPVDESEFHLIGLKEYNRSRSDWIRMGFLFGFCCAVIAFALLTGLK
jgi:hypothetical protein